MLAVLSPPSSCFWCFSCFLCFLVLFRSFYVLPWFIKHQKASKSTAAVFFYSFCCELDSSKKHHKAPKSTTSVAAVAEVRYSFHLLFVHFLCLPLPPPPLNSVLFGAFRAFRCFFVITMFSLGAQSTKKHAKAR